MSSPAQKAIDELSWLIEPEMLAIADLLPVRIVRTFCAASPEMDKNVCNNDKYWKKRVKDIFGLTVTTSLPRPLTYRRLYEMLEIAHDLEIITTTINYSYPKGQRSKHITYGVPRFTVYKIDGITAVAPDVSFTPIHQTSFVCVAMNRRQTFIGPLPPLYKLVNQVAIPITNIPKRQMKNVQAQLDFFRQWGYSDMFVIEDDYLPALLTEAYELFYKEIFFDDSKMPFKPVDADIVANNADMFTFK